MIMEKSYNKWRKYGRQVKRGETSIRRSKKGTPLFHISQTKPYQTSHDRAVESSWAGQFNEDFDYDDHEWLYNESFQ